MSGVTCPVCAECFSTAINVEIAVRIYYLKMADLFAKVPDAAEIFRLMAQDESEHARTLGEAKTTGRHSDSVHGNAKTYTRSLIKLIDDFGKTMNDLPKNLDDAWEFAYTLERSEINNIYIRLIVGTRTDLDGGEKFVLDLINEHLRRLNVLAQKYVKTQRQAILPTAK